jgi:hypothetical protein
MEKAKAYLQTRGSKVNFLYEGIGPGGSTLRPMLFQAHANIPKGKFAVRRFGRITIRQRKSFIIWV